MSIPRYTILSNKAPKFTEVNTEEELLESMVKLMTAIHFEEVKNEKMIEKAGGKAEITIEIHLIEDIYSISIDKWNSIPLIDRFYLAQIANLNTEPFEITVSHDRRTETFNFHVTCSYLEIVSKKAMSVVYESVSNAVFTGFKELPKKIHERNVDAFLTFIVDEEDTRIIPLLEKYFTKFEEQ